MGDIGRALIIIGGVLLAMGLLLTLAGRLPWLGRLPGDIVLQRRNFTLYIPIATGLLISLLLSLVLWLIGKK